MRVGIFGGTFDPVHLGHLIIAEQSREQAGLDQVWFVPSARPPHKLDRSVTPFDRRAEMLQLAIAGQPDFRVELIEKDRPGPSFTADTLGDLKRVHPENELFLILGADCLPDLPKWHDPTRILELSTLLVASRPGCAVWKPEQLAEAVGLAVPTGVRMQQIDNPLVEIASQDLRRKAAEGRSLLFLVPRAVEVYIREKNLYRS
jgi:nicotinate-nucleotide adenylyltransferase